MRVDFTTYGVEPPENNKTSGTGQPRASGTASSSTSEPDEASFSFDQERVQSLAAQVLAQPEIRAAKVQSLQEAIGNGEYSIPASQVAGALANELSGAA